MKHLFQLFFTILVLTFSGSLQAQSVDSYYGEPFDPEAATSFSDFYEQASTTDSLSGKLLGLVEEVCQMKGCWMTIRATDQDLPAIMVKFKDYGFFVPKDISGRQVVLQGIAFREVTPVEELRHYAEDAGKSKTEIEAITEPKEELKFIATGVALLEE